jgi:hypothetical protein
VVRALDDLGLFWCEIDLYDPVSYGIFGTPCGHPLRHANRSLACGVLSRVFEQYAMDVAIIDGPWNGIWQSLRSLPWLRRMKSHVAPHNFYGHLSTLMSAHLCAAVPNFALWKLILMMCRGKMIADLCAPDRQRRTAVATRRRLGAGLNEEAICSPAKKPACSGK